MADLYDEKAAARVVGVHPRTVRRWRDAGLLAFYRTPTGRIRYKLEDLIAATTIERVEPANGRACPPLSADAHSPKN